MIKPTEFPQLIKDFRESLCLSQEGFGRRYDRTNKAVSTWETGRNMCPIEVILDVINMRGSDFNG